MKKIFMIDGGAGRVIAAIPSLKKYLRNNPDDDIKIFVYGWDAMYWSIPELQNITMPSELKDQFNTYFYDADEVITPEPYRLPSYYRQEVSLVEAFDQIINNTTDHTDIDAPQIKLMQSEKYYGQKLIDEAKQAQGKEKTIVIQPFGRSTDIAPNGKIFDNSSRSMDPVFFLKLCELLSEKYNLILMAEPQFHMEEDRFTYKAHTDLRGLPCLIDAADYFVGCDSVGQHIARGLDKQGTVIFGSTFPKNTSYPDFFQIIEKDVPKVFSPIRLVQTDCNFADRSNAGCMNFTDEEIILISKRIEKHLEQNC